MKYTAVLLCCVLSTPAFGDGSPDAGVDIPDGGRAIAAEALMKGEAAPFNGVLLTEERLKRYISSEIEVESLKLQVAARDQALANPVTSPTTSSWQFWAGMGTGVLVTVGILIGAAKLIESTSPKK